MKKLLSENILFDLISPANAEAVIFKFLSAKINKIFPDGLQNLISLIIITLIDYR